MNILPEGTENNEPHFEVESIHNDGEWLAPTRPGVSMQQIRFVQMKESWEFADLAVQNSFTFLTNLVKDNPEAIKYIKAIRSYCDDQTTDLKELSNEVVIARNWHLPSDEQCKVEHLREAAPDLLEAAKAAEHDLNLALQRLPRPPYGPDASESYALLEKLRAAITKAEAMQS